MTNQAYHYSSQHNRNYQQHAERQQRLKAIEFSGEDDFKIKAYTKSELADMYGVHVNTLSKWIDRHLPAFEELGYTKTLKMLDPAMIKLFISIFSTP
ncbi:hypothetical protein OKW21_005031 [Catalinimonas alkaloidigena]|uniref:hypothetical protein n=1 Tax=Catalinimonas alkaloidigena TaxID=1075417 RepID=UPI00240635E4|nr:hypothetical protein [Catalinimonas alkaloidigena]MDF9799768.1 hypothetical protein [Catalinimonas alkaloidigena]